MLRYEQFINEELKQYEIKQIKFIKNKLISYSFNIDKYTLIIEFKYFNNIILFDFYEKNNYMTILNKGAFSIMNTVLNILKEFINNTLENNQYIIVVPVDKRRELLYRRYIKDFQNLNIFIKNSKIINNYNEIEYQNIGIITKNNSFDWETNYDTIKSIFRFMDDYNSINDFKLEIL